MADAGASAAAGTTTAAQGPEIVAASARLKYLGFIPIVAFKATLYIVNLYEHAKGSSGPLKPGLDRVEGTVKTVVGPVYQKIQGKPVEVLTFLDVKIGDGVRILDGVLPPKVKDLGSQAYDAAQQTVAEVRAEGVYTTAKGYYDKYEPVAEAYGVEAYKKALTFPFVPEVVKFARFGALRVNEVIVSLKNHGLPLASYLPLLPVGYFDKITQS